MLLILTGCQTKPSSDIAEETKNSIVLISYGDKKGHGTGFFVKAKGQCKVLTSAHVVRRSKQINITPHLDKKLFKAANIEPIPGKDLALVTFQVDDQENCPYTPLKLNKSPQIKIRDTVAMVGYPRRDGETTLVLQFPEGKVTNIEDPPLAEGYAISYEMTTIQGMSGGPVINKWGRVVAVHGKTDVVMDSLENSSQGSPDTQSLSGSINHFKWGVPIESYFAYIDSQPSTVSFKQSVFSSFFSTNFKLILFLLLGPCFTFFTFKIILVSLKKQRRSNTIQPIPRSTPVIRQPPRQKENSTVSVKPSSTPIKPKQEPKPSKENEHPTLEEFTFETKKVKVENGTFQGLITRSGTAKQFKEKLADGVNLEMVAIPGGSFVMGGEGFDDEKPKHRVDLSSYYMGKYPVTQEQWYAIAKATELKVNIDLEPAPSYFIGGDRPVETVSWYGCVEFCQRLSKLTGRNYTLPSEAQWEYACRAGTTTPFYFGETIATGLANYNGNKTYGCGPKGVYKGETTPVYRFPANGFGLYDMHGNVWEWCADDWHDNYNGAPNDGSAWLEYDLAYLAKNRQDDSKSVLRGGSWGYYPDICRSAFRVLNSSRGNHDFYYGFRVVCVFGRNL